MSVTSLPQLGFARPAIYESARQWFDRVDYTPSGLQQLLGCGPMATVSPQRLPAMLYRTRRLDPLATLARLFFLNEPVPAASLQKALEPFSLAEWAAAGLFALQGEVVRPRVRLIYFRDRIFASDVPARLREAPRDDFVMGVGESSALLSQMSMQRPVSRTLDWGAGNGVQGVMCSSFSEQVVCTDKNPRAAQFIRFNAAWNGVTNVESRTGDSFEPVQGERFDFICCSPPYVISPKARFMFCDSGMRGDEFCRALVRSFPDYLVDGGFCHMLANWPHAADGDWRDGLEGWFDGLGCDVTVWGGETETADAYVTSWLSDIGTKTTQVSCDAYAEWRDYLAGIGVDAISYGIITLRRRVAAKNWICLDDSPDSMPAPCGDLVLRRFAVEDFLQQCDEQRLLQEPLTAARDVRLYQTHAPQAEGFGLEQLEMRRDGAMRYASVAEPHVASLLVGCDGRRPLRAVFDDIAASLNVEQAALIPSGLELVRRLIRYGYLLPRSFVAEG